MLARSCARGHHCEHELFLRDQAVAVGINHLGSQPVAHGEEASQLCRVQLSVVIVVKVTEYRICCCAWVLHWAILATASAAHARRCHEFVIGNVTAVVGLQFASRARLLTS